MKNVIDFFSQPWLGTFIGILGLGAAVFFYIRSRNVSKLAFQSDGVTILGSGAAAFPEEIEIRFAMIPVSKVTAERVVIWNAGNTTIGGEQITSSDPLRIELQGGSDILKVDILKTTRKVNAFRLAPQEESKRIVDIHFQYLDPGDGMLLSVLHSGNQGNLKLLGTLRGIPSGIDNFGRAPWFYGQSSQLFTSIISNRVLGLICLFSGVVALLLAALIIYPVMLNSQFAQKIEKLDLAHTLWVLIPFGVIYIPIGAYIFRERRKRYPSSLDIADSATASIGNKTAEQGSATDAQAPG